MSELASLDKPNAKQKGKLNQIKDELRAIMFPKGRTLIERVVERDYYADLESRTEEFKRILEK